MSATALTADGPAALISDLLFPDISGVTFPKKFLKILPSLAAKKIKLDADDVVQSLSAFRAAAVLVNPGIQIVAARDPDDDDKILRMCD